MVLVRFSLKNEFYNLLNEKQEETRYPNSPQNTLTS
jgi:hypothetical protein